MPRITRVHTLSANLRFAPIWSHETRAGRDIHVFYRCPNTGWVGRFVVRGRLPDGPRR
jgi:hypothetical protein